MAAISFVRSFPAQTNQRIVQLVWSPMAATDIGDAAAFAQYNDRSVQVSGTISAGSISIKGSNDGVTYHTLTDPQGNPLSFSSAGLEAISELVFYIRPEASADLAGSGIFVTLIAKGAE